MGLSIEELSKPVSEENPAGDNLEYDAQFMELVNLFEAKPKAGASVEDADGDSGPDWKGIEKLAGQLSSKTRDLRIQVYAAIAAIHTSGLPALRDNLQVIKIYLADFWDSVHPQLDPDDDNDPMLRANTLEILNEYALISIGLENVKLVELRGLGVFTPRTVALAEGKETPNEGEDVPDVNLIRQAFASAEADEMTEVQTAVSDIRTLFDEINGVWIEKSGDAAGLMLGNATKAMTRIEHILAEYAPGGGGGGDVGGDVDVAGAGAGESPQAGGAAPVQTISGTVNSRSDVVKALDRVCDYYSAHEPSSPIPLLLRRAQRLVEKSFMEILEDMAPDGVTAAKMVSGDD